MSAFFWNLTKMCPSRDIIYSPRKWFGTDQARYIKPQVTSYTKNKQRSLIVPSHSRNLLCVTMQNPCSSPSLKCIFHWSTRPRFNATTQSNQYSCYHHKNKTVSWPSYLFNRNIHNREDGLYIEPGTRTRTFTRPATGHSLSEIYLHISNTTHGVRPSVDIPLTILTWILQRILGSVVKMPS